MTADAGEEGKNGKINFYPGHLDSKSTHPGSSPDGEVFLLLLVGGKDCGEREAHCNIG